MPRIRFEEILQNLSQALDFCESIGLGNHLANSRFTEYRQRLERLVELVYLRQSSSAIIPIPNDIVEQLREYLAALMESAEFSNLLPYLRQCDVELIRQKLRHVFKGPPLPSDEDASSNQARNIQFELYLAHQLGRAGLSPTLGEHPDLRCEIDGIAFLFECKRLFSHSPRAIGRRIQEAGHQLHRTRSRQLAGACGIVAISLSTLLNPDYKAIHAANEPTGRALLESWLEEQAEGVRDEWLALGAKGRATGILFHASSPFINLDTERFDYGQYFVGYPLVSENSPYYAKTLKLANAMQAIQY